MAEKDSDDMSWLRREVGKNMFDQPTLLTLTINSSFCKFVIWYSIFSCTVFNYLCRKSHSIWIICRFKNICHSRLRYAKPFTRRLLLEEWESNSSHSWEYKLYIRPSSSSSSSPKFIPLVIKLERARQTNKIHRCWDPTERGRRDFHASRQRESPLRPARKGLIALTRQLADDRRR